MKKRQTKQLKTVIGSDLLTAREKFIMGQSGGFYSLADEQAYFKLSSDKSSMTVPEFERYLKEKIDRNFMITFNPAKTAEHVIIGHSIYFFIPAWDSFIPVCKVGKSGDNILPANSQGKVVKYKGQRYKNSGGILDEEPILWRGWVAAFEACKLAYEDWERNGIEPSRAISPKEAIAMKKIYTVMGNKNVVTSEIKKLSDKKLIDELANKAYNIELLKRKDLKKYVNKTDENSNIFLEFKEWEEMNEDVKKNFLDIWKELTEEEVNLKIENFERDSEDIKKEIIEDEEKKGE